jgi:hypothetical protein
VSVQQTLEFAILEYGIILIFYSVGYSFMAHDSTRTETFDSDATTASLRLLLFDIVRFR